jgi:hypothetical protein
MNVTDLNGTEITVTDIKAAIKQAAAFKTYRHQSLSPAQLAGDGKLQEYWADMHAKLLQLQTDISLKTKEL